MNISAAQIIKPPADILKKIKIKVMSTLEQKIQIYYELIEYFNDAIDDIFEDVELPVLDIELKRIKKITEKTQMTEAQKHDTTKVLNYLTAIKNVITARRALFNLKGERISDK